MLVGVLVTGLLSESPLAAQDKAGDVLRQAVELHQSGHYPEAIEAYQSYLEVHPEAAAVRSNLGAALAHEGRYSDAIREYNVALAAQPSNSGIRLNLALAFYKTGEIASAVKEFEAVYAVLEGTNPQKRQVSLLLAECYTRQGDDEKVIALLSPLADADANDLTAAYLLGTALLHQGQEERGALMIQRILKNGDTAQAHMLMAYTRMKANDSKGAMEEIDRALALNPNLPEAYCLRGRLAFIVSDLDGAQTAFRKALALDPNTFDALLLLGTLLRQQGQLKEAHSLLENAVQLRPKEIRARYQFALQYSAEGNDKRAAEKLESLIKDVPEYIEAHRSLATIYFRLGRPEEGREQRKVAEKMDAAVQSQNQERGRSLK